MLLNMIEFEGFFWVKQFIFVAVTPFKTNSTVAKLILVDYFEFERSEKIQPWILIFLMITIGGLRIVRITVAFQSTFDSANKQSI